MVTKKQLEEQLNRTEDKLAVAGLIALLEFVIIVAMIIW